MLILQAAAEIPYESLGVVGLLAVAVVTLWRLNASLAKKNEKLHEGAVEKAELEAKRAVETAERHVKIIQSNTEAQREATSATKDLTKAFEANTKVVELMLARLQGPGG